MTSAIGLQRLLQRSNDIALNNEPLWTLLNNHTLGEGSKGFIVLLYQICKRDRCATYQVYIGGITRCGALQTTTSREAAISQSLDALPTEGEGAPQAGENGTPNALARSSANCGPTRSGAASTAAGWLGASARLPQHSEAQRGRLPIFARASGLLAAMFPVVEPVSPSVSSRPTSPCSSATWSWPHESPQRTLALLPYRQSPRAEPSSRSLSVPATQRHAPCSRDARLDR